MPGYNIWDAVAQGQETGEGMVASRNRRRLGEAYETGGLNAMEQEAGRSGDLTNLNNTQVMRQRQRTFANEETERGFRWFEQNAPYARHALRAARGMDPERRGQFLNGQRQRFLHMGFTDQQIDGAIAQLTNPETAEQAFQEFDAAFTQHEDPNWQIRGNQVVGIDPQTGAVQTGGTVPEQPDWQTNGTRPYYVDNQGTVHYGQGEIPRAVSGGGGVQYRPVTPEEAADLGLPGNGDGFVIGDNGLPRRVGGGGTFPADQRARVAIQYEPALEATRLLEQLETDAVRRQGSHGSSTPLGQDWGARMLEAVPFDGGSAARAVGGADYGRYVSASRAFEAAMLPILSGAAVTESEAVRIVRSTIPQLNDSREVLADKARRRRQMLNGAALIGGRDAPYPADGVPDWAARAQQAYSAPSLEDSGGVGLESLSDEQLDALEQELLNGGQ